jgi:hypothetical protein
MRCSMSEAIRSFRVKFSTGFGYGLWHLVCTSTGSYLLIPSTYYLHTMLYDEHSMNLGIPACDSTSKYILIMTKIKSSYCMYVVCTKLLFYLSWHVHCTNSFYDCCRKAQLIIIWPGPGGPVARSLCLGRGRPCWGVVPVTQAVQAADRGFQVQICQPECRPAGQADCDAAGWAAPAGHMVSFMYIPLCTFLGLDWPP